jgi:hypothetical protein
MSFEAPIVASFAGGISEPAVLIVLLLSLDPLENKSKRDL